MFPGLHNIPPHFGLVGCFFLLLLLFLGFFLTWGFWQCLFYSLFIRLLLKIHSSFPSYPSPKPHLDVDRRQEKLWSLGGFVLLWGHCTGCPFPGLLLSRAPCLGLSLSELSIQKGIISFSALQKR